MTFAMLALICLIALVGPLVALPRRVGVPVVIGEIAVGIAFGATGTGWVDAGDETFKFLADIGFALVLFFAGTNVPIHSDRMREGLWRGAGRAALVGLLAVPAGIGVNSLFGGEHALLYSVLIASSSASVVLPVLGETEVRNRKGMEMLVQIAIADAVCIIALPLVLIPDETGRAALGVVAVLVTAVVFWFVLRLADRRGWDRRIHEVSKERDLALELRFTLMLLFTIASVAAFLEVSIMLAGFALGIAVSSVGQSRRVDHQVFAMTEGFFGPVFYVWLGASVNLRELADEPQQVLLGLAIGVAAVLLRGAAALTGLPVPMATATAAQLGVPIGAVALGSEAGVLDPGESAGILLGAMVTLLVVTLVSRPLKHAVAQPDDGDAGSDRRATGADAERAEPDASA
ncbi:MAG: cation:proton antiporter [Microbacteriaceae bacterium]|nr:cation:proton antiporter [Microbacteriaceae bacterium]